MAKSSKAITEEMQKLMVELREHTDAIGEIKKKLAGKSEERRKITIAERKAIQEKQKKEAAEAQAKATKDAAARAKAAKK